jgi:hypothetical protein
MNNAVLRRSIKIYTIFFVLLSACKDEEDKIVRPLPEIVQLRPSKGMVGDIITVAGHNFSPNLNDNQISFDGVSATLLTIEGDSIVTVVVPENTTTGPVAISVDEFGSEGPIFTVVENITAPVLLAVSSSKLETGQTFAVSGNNFLTGGDSARNVARIGNFRLPLLRANASELILTVPAGVKGDNLSLTVSIGETVSNSIPISVTGFTSQLHWALIPNNNNPIDGFSQFIVSGSADGSDTRMRPYFSVPDDTAETKNNLLYPITYTTYDASGDTFYSVNQNSKLLYRYNWQWESMDTIYQPATINFHPQGPIIIHNFTGDKYFFGNDGSKILLYRGNDIDFAQASLHSFTYPLSMSVGKQYIYVLDGGRVFKSSLDDAIQFEAIDLSSLPAVTSGSGITKIQYSNFNKKLYILYEKEFKGLIELYEWDELSGEISLLCNNIPPEASNLTIPDDQESVRIYFTAPDIPILATTIPMNLWMINLRENTNGVYGPVVIHHNITIIPDRQETNGTRIVDRVGLMSYNAIGFLTIDDL